MSENFVTLAVALSLATLAPSLFVEVVLDTYSCVDGAMPASGTSEGHPACRLRPSAPSRLRG